MENLECTEALSLQADLGPRTHPHPGEQTHQFSRGVPPKRKFRVFLEEAGGLHDRDEDLCPGKEEAKQLPMF